MALGKNRKRGRRKREKENGRKKEKRGKKEEKTNFYAEKGLEIV